MLGKVLSNQEDEVMENIKVRDLPTVGLKVSGNDGDESEVFKLMDGAVCCRFATSPLRGKVFHFRVYLAVVYVEEKHIVNTQELSGGKAERALDKMAHMVKSFKKEFL